MLLDGQTVLVTGAGGFVGRASGRDVGAVMSGFLDQPGLIEAGIGLTGNHRERWHMR